MNLKEKIKKNEKYGYYYQDTPITHNYNEYYSDSGKRFGGAIELLVKLFRLSRATYTFLFYPKMKSILDIGCGRGYTVYYLKKIFGVPTAEGTQVSKNAIDFAREKLHLNIYEGCLSNINFDNKKYDLISIYHVLEHVKDPKLYIDIISNLLKNDAKLIIEVPNYQSWTSKVSGDYWLGLDLENHTHFFTYQSLATLLEKNNLKIIKKSFFSFEYSTFISTSSLMSHLTKTDHIFFNFLLQKKLSTKTIIHSFAFLLLFPICFLVNIFLIYSKRGEVIKIIAKK